MQKDEILEISRKENKEKDVFEREVIRDAGNIGSMVAGILATVFFVLQIFTGGGMNYGLYAVVFSISAAGFVYKSIKLKRRHEIAVAVIYCVATLLFASAHIYQLFTASEIL